MLDKNDDWGIIEAAYQNLMDAAGFPKERPAAPETLHDYDLLQAAETTMDEIAGAFPEIALLKAFARNGYLDDDPIWQNIAEAIARGIEAYEAQEYEDWQDSIEHPEAWGLE